ncbi:MAG: 50S ribosomal protein L10 [Candidatus Omnitrophica bacterium]|nr:50S ribosomal protein L10 [Candidatus Omnitrophota bacterium]
MSTEKDLKPGRFLKTRMVKEYADRFKGSPSIFVTEFSGLKNKELEELRKKLQPSATDYMIVKNALCKLALKDIKLEKIADMVDGACALGYSEGDPVLASKTLVEFAKANKSLILKGGYMDGAVITADTIKELASLPSREVLIARLVSSINAPISGLVGVFSGLLKKLLYAINEIIKKKDEAK